MEVIPDANATSDREPSGSSRLHGSLAFHDLRKSAFVIPLEKPADDGCMGNPGHDPVHIVKHNPDAISKHVAGLPRERWGTNKSRVAELMDGLD